MSRRLIIRPEAESDIIKAAVWYESREAGLGLDVNAEIRAAINRPLEHPGAHTAAQTARGSSHCCGAISLSNLLHPFDLTP